MTIVRVRFTPNGVPTPGKASFVARHDEDNRPIVSGRDILNGKAEWEDVPVEGKDIDVRPQDAGWHYVVRVKADGHPQQTTTVLVPPNGPVDFGSLVRYDPKAGMAYEPDPNWWAHLAGVEVGLGAVQSDVHTAKDQAEGFAAAASNAVSHADTAAQQAQDAARAAELAKNETVALGSISQGDEWLWAVVDSNDSILGGWKTDGTFETFGGMSSGADTSVWPAVAYGDSTTEGADLLNPTSERWTTLLATSLGQPILNRGASGARAEEITARQGGISFTAGVTGNTIPASGPVTLTNLGIDPIRSGGVVSLGVQIEGVAGTLTKSGDNRVFTRSTTGSPLTVPAVVDVYSTEGESLRRNIHIIGQGTNNTTRIESGEQTLDQLCAWYTAQTSTLEPARPRFIVWGVLDRGASEGQGTARGTLIRQLEAFLSKTYGAAFVNVRAYLASYRALAEAGITPTSNDDASIAVGSIPPSLRSSFGSVHLNAAGHVIQANLFKRHIIRNGLV